ncbi:hypothetical protein PRIC2_009564 [Phytophthora ramorum]
MESSTVMAWYQRLAALVLVALPARQPSAGVERVVREEDAVHGEGVANFQPGEWTELQKLAHLTVLL